MTYSDVIGVQEPRVQCWASQPALREERNLSRSQISALGTLSDSASLNRSGTRTPSGPCAVVYSSNVGSRHLTSLLSSTLSLLPSAPSDSSVRPSRASRARAAGSAHANSYSRRPHTRHLDRSTSSQTSTRSYILISLPLRPRYCDTSLSGRLQCTSITHTSTTTLGMLPTY